MSARAERLFRFFLAAAYITTVLTAQESVPAPQVLLLSGTVVDVESRAPVPNAIVSVTPGREVRYGDSTSPPSLSSHTGMDGRFSIDVGKAGLYGVYVTADGFRAGPGLPLFISITKPHSVELGVIRTSAINGRLIDETSREPLTGFNISPIRIRYTFDTPSFLVEPLPTARSDTNGNFAIKDLPPGLYVLEIEHPAYPEKVVARPVGDISEDGGLGYGRESVFEGAPLRLYGGADVDLPDVRLTKKTLFRIKGRLLPDQCRAGDLYQVTLLRRHGRTIATQEPADVACENPYSVVNLPPGSYELIAEARTKVPTEARVAWATVQIASRDVSQDLYPSSPIPVTTELSIPEGFPEKDRELIKIAVDDLAGFSVLQHVKSIGPNGLPVFGLLQGWPVQINVSGLKGSYYVSEVSYNGHPFPDGVITPRTDVAAQLIKVSIKEGAAVLRGTFEQKDGAASATTAVLVPWPLRWKADTPVYYEQSIGDKGSFVFPAVPPGKYHLFATATNNWDTAYQVPGAFTQLAHTGMDVTLERGKTEHVIIDRVSTLAIR